MQTETEQKTCRKCEKAKSIDEFQKDWRRKDGHTNLCKSCASNYANEWHRNNREHHNQKMRDWWYKDKQRRPEVYIWSMARRRAKQTGRPFSITPDDIRIPDVCPALGLKLEFGVGHNQPNSPSIDAIIPALGYVPGNIAIISHRANGIKQNVGPEELRKVADWLEKALTEKA